MTDETEDQAVPKAIQEPRRGNSLVVPFFLLLTCFWMVCPGRSSPSSDADRYLQRLAETQNFSLGRPKQAEPTADGKAVIFVRTLSPRERTAALYEFNAESLETTLLARPDVLLGGATEHLSPEEKARRERTRMTMGGITSFKLSRDPSEVVFSLNGKIFVLKRRDGKVTPLDTGEGPVIDPTPSPDGQYVAYARNNNLFVYNLGTHQARAITTDGTELKSYGTAEFVAQEEMDRRSGYWWLPDSRSIVYQINDNSPVEVWHVGDPASPENHPLAVRYPRPGKANVSVRLAISSIDQPQKVRPIEWDYDRYPYLVSVTPAENGPLTITVETREQHDLVLMLVDPATGQTKTLLLEHDPAWVNVDQKMPYWLPSGKFLWTSERAGAWQLELHQADGQLEKVIVPPDVHFQRLGGVTASGVFFLASKDPSKHQIWRVCLDGRDLTLVSDGVHAVSFGNHQDSIYVDVLETPTALARSFVRRVDGTTIGELPSIAEEPASYPRLEFTLVSDSPAFHAAIVRPFDFVANKKYPVIVDAYGGPGYNRVVQAAQSFLISMVS